MPGARHILEVLVTGNSRGAIAALDQFETKANRTFGAATTGIQKTEAALVRSGAVAVGFAAVTGAALLSAGQEAAVLEQRVTATGKIFGEARRPVDEFAKSAASVAGLSEAEARTATARIGSLLQNYGFSAEEAAAKSIELTKVGADLALTFGRPVEEAVSAVAATLRGERDPIEQFGIALKETDVTARVAALGLQTGTAAANSHAKAVATLSLIQEQTASSAGAFADAQDTAAGKLAVFGAEMKNLKANIGAGVLPVLTSLTGLLSTGAAGFNSLSQSQQTAVGSTLALTTATVGTLGGIALVSGAALKARTALTGMSSGAGIAAGAFTGMVAAFSISAALLESQTNAMTLDMEQLTTSLVDLGKSGQLGGELERALGAGGENIGQMVDKINEVNTDALIGQIDALGTSWLQMGDDITSAGSAQGWEQIDAALAALVSGGKMEQAGAAVNRLQDLFRAQGRSVNELYALIPGFVDAVYSVADAQAAAAHQTDLHAAAIEGVRSAVSDERARIDSALATERVVAAQERLADLQDEAAKAGRADSDAARRAADAQRSVADAVRSRADAVKDLQEAQEDLATFQSAAEQGIRGLEREQILRRRIGTAEEARQKEIDLYRFDQRVAEEGERLQDGVVSAERQVEDATRRVGDAHQDVADQARDRAEKEKDFAGEIRKAQLDVDAAALGVLETYIKTADELGTNTTQAKLLRDELLTIAGLIGPDSPIGKLIAGGIGGAGTTGFTGALSFLNSTFAGPLSAGQSVLASAAQAGTLNTDLLKKIAEGKDTDFGLTQVLNLLASPAGAAGDPRVIYLMRALGIPGYQTGGIVAGPAGRPQLAVVHGGEQITPPGTSRVSGGLSIVQNNQFVGGDVPTVTQLDAQNRKLGIRVALSGRRG